MTQFWLCENVPFNSEYEHVVSFDNQGSQQTYFLDLSVHTENANRFRIVDNKVGFRINRTYENSLNLNYVVLLQGGKYYYLFIDSVAYVDVDTTHVSATIDVWQTYMFDYDVKDAFISREHQDRFKKVGSSIEPVYNLNHEDIELGEEYEVTEVEVKKDEYNLSNISGEHSIRWYYIVTSEPLNKDEVIDGVSFKDKTTVDDLVVGYYLYCFPILKVNGSNQPIHFEDDTLDFPVRVNFYYNTIGDRGINQLLKNPIVVGAYISNYSPIPYSLYRSQGGTGAWYIDFPNGYIGKGVSFRNNANVMNINQTDIIRYDEYEFDLKRKYNVNTSIQSKNIKLEPKLRVKPYTIFSFTDMVSESLDLGENEFDKIYYRESYGPQYKSIIGTNKYDITKYFNYNVSSKNNELPLSNDRYVNYIMNNKASATTGVALSGLGMLAGVGVATAGAMTGTGIATYMGISQTLNSGKSIINELLKKSDLKQSPNTLREIGNNSIFQLELKNNSFILNGIVRQVKKQYYERAYEYFYRLGYKANRFGVPNIRSRKYFNYIECTTINITGNIPQGTIKKIEEIYTRGTTVWHQRDDVDVDVYNYTRENWEVSLLG